MNRYAHFSPMTDTVELRSTVRGTPPADLPTTEIGFPWFRPSPPTRITRRPWSAALRKTGAVLLLIAGLMALSAEPSSAHPVHDAPRYYGPTVTCWTAEQLFPWATDRTCQ